VSGLPTVDFADLHVGGGPGGVICVTHGPERVPTDFHMTLEDAEALGVALIQAVAIGRMSEHMQ
jgi:hypothetical protein